MIVMGAEHGPQDFEAKRPYPMIKFPMVRDGRDRRLLTVGTMPKVTTVNPRDAFRYPAGSYLRVNQWDSRYQPDTTAGARWSDAFVQFAGMGSEGKGTEILQVPAKEKYARRIAKVQYPIGRDMTFRPYPLAGMGGMGESILDVAKTGVKTVTGQVGDISDKLDQVKVLLLVSTGASVLGALLALARR